MQAHPSRRRAATVLAAAALVTGVGVAARHLPSTAAAQASPSAPFPAQVAAGTALGSDVIPEVAEAVVESVVNISSTRAVTVGPASHDPFFNDPRSPFYLEPDQRQAQSLGSGVIVNARGRIITNAHVVDQ